MISQNFKKRFYTSVVLLIIFFLIFEFSYLLVLSLLILGVLSIIEFAGIIKKLFKNKYYIFFTNFFWIIFIFSYCFLFFFFSNFIQLKIILFSLLLGCIASDIGGFIVGKIFKGPKLTKVSPNKTVSGPLAPYYFLVLRSQYQFFISQITLATKL